MALSEYVIPGMFIRDHIVTVPLDWSKPDGETIEVFAREVCDPTKRNATLPLLAFLQGGPGGKSPRPANGGPPWLAEALKSHRVILVDQRGTGRSSRIESATMARFGDDGAKAADYLALLPCGQHRCGLRAHSQNVVWRKKNGRRLARAMVAS